MASVSNLTLPFRRSNHLSLSSVIRPYIDSKYGQHPDMFRHDLEVIDALRKDAVNVREAHSSGIRKLQAYAAQLTWIGGKFPIDIGAEFTWYPTLGYNTDRPLVADNLKYELLNVLYNLAALYTQLAASAEPSTTDRLKSSAHYFNLAAGTLTYMQRDVLPHLRMSSPPDDMDHQTLEALVQLCLAQSQERFWQRAVLDGYKDLSISRLAATVSDFYDAAYEAATKSDSVSNDWIAFMAAKQNHFAGAAQLRMACECLERKRYGEEIARLKDVVACAGEGLHHMRKYRNDRIVEDLNGLKKRAEEDLKRAERDNDVIYLNPVPPKAELAKLERATMAVAKIPPQVAAPLDHLGDKTEFGPALFTKLVPFAVHNAVSIYEERRDRIINQNLIQQLEGLNAKMREFLANLGLPGSLQALEKPLGLPNNLVQHAEEIRQTDGVQRLEQLFSDLQTLRDENLKDFQEGRMLLDLEADEDSRLRAKYGTERWTRPDGRTEPQGQQLHAKVAEIEGYLNHSSTSDAAIRDKFSKVRDRLNLLAGTDRGLLDYVPSSRTIDLPPALKAAIGPVRRTYDDVLRLESRRRKKIEALEDMKKLDDIKPDILKEAARLERTYPTTEIKAAHFEDYFNKRLDEKYDPEFESVDREAASQEKLLVEAQRANRELDSQKRRADGAGRREREKALQKLEDAFGAYKEIKHHLGQARTFYNDLRKVTGNGFLALARGWVNERRVEAMGLEQELKMPPLQSLSLSQQPAPSAAAESQTAPAYRPQPVSAAQMAPQAPVHPGAGAQIQAWADGSVASPPQQPKPGVWSPEIGIRFGGGAQGGGVPKGGTWDPSSGIRFG